MHAAGLRSTNRRCSLASCLGVACTFLSVTLPQVFPAGARRADVTGFGVPEHHGDGSTLPMLVQSGNLSLEIWSSGILMEPVAP
jgi:hypothetical protein